MLVKSKPDAKSAFLDDFLVKRDHGELADYVAKLAKESDLSNSQSIPTSFKAAQAVTAAGCSPVSTTALDRLRRTRMRPIMETRSLGSPFYEFRRESI